MIELIAYPRQVLGKGLKALRRQGFTPANLYGAGLKSMPLQVETKTLRHTLSKTGKNVLLTLRIDGDSRSVFIREAQRDPLSRDFLHVDFYQVSLTERMRSEVRLTFVGEVPAVQKLGGILYHSLGSLEIEALPADLPSSIEVNVSVLEEIGQTIHVKDLVVGDKLTVLTDPDEVVAKVLHPVVEEEVKEAPPAPEKTEEKQE